MKTITIGSRQLGMDKPPFIVAEISANHNQSLEAALLLVQAAKAAGAHAIKLQTYTPDTMTLDIQEREFVINDPKSPWCGKSLYQLYQEAYTPWKWHQQIFQRAHELDLIAFSTPFDSTAVGFLESLNVPCYKIASLEITDHPLIQAVASTGKPLIISTGTATLEEIDEAVTVARKSGCEQLILLKCTSAYPASPSDANLRTLPHMAETFDTLVGLSDHTLGVSVAVASIALGACLIEKHITLSRAKGGVDSTFSLEPQEFSELVSETHIAWQALGKQQYGPTKSEATSHSLRRSLYFVKDLKKGEQISADHVRAIRPGSGLPIKELDRVIGRNVRVDVKRGQAVRWELLALEGK